MRRYQVATAAVLIAIAAVAMFDTRGGALPDVASGAPGGLKGGWYPFWSAALSAVALAAVTYQVLRTPQKGDVFSGREGVLSLLALLIPMIVLVILMDRLLGFYIAAFLYLAWFARVIGRYKWHWVAASAVTIPVALFFVFESFFKVGLPKSVWFTQGLPF